MAFRGTFDHTLDAKNRLTVPAKFRGALADGAVLAKGVESCVALWTPDAYDAYVQASLQGLHPLSPQATQLKRYFSANAVDVELDAANRVMVPSFLAEHANLEKEVVVTGSGDCLELWDRAAWAAYNEQLSADVVDITTAFGAGFDETGS
jgi:MraZ protein